MKKVNLLNETFNEKIREIIREELNKPLEVEIKYHDDNMPKMVKLDRGNWVDCERTLEDGTIEKTKKITYHKGDFLMLPLGISIKQPKGYEVNLLPRSSTFKNFGIIQANSMAVGDDTFISDNDMYHYPAIALTDGEMYLYDRICQMQVNKTTNLKLNEVKTLGENETRGGFGESGVK